MIFVEGHFDAAHFLRGYQGKCEALHGHRFAVVVKIQATQLDDIGLAYDFTRLRQQLGQVVGRFDHVCLNDTPPFDKINPSSENIASTIFTELQPILTGTGFSLSNIQVWESPHSSVTYFPEGE